MAKKKNSSTGRKSSQFLFASNPVDSNSERIPCNVIRQNYNALNFMQRSGMVLKEACRKKLR